MRKAFSVLYCKVQMGSNLGVLTSTMKSPWLLWQLLLDQQIAANNKKGIRSGILIGSLALGKITHCLGYTQRKTAEWKENFTLFLAYNQLFWKVVISYWNYIKKGILIGFLAWSKITQCFKALIEKNKEEKEILLNYFSTNKFGKQKKGINFGILIGSLPHCFG